MALCEASVKARAPKKKNQKIREKKKKELTGCLRAGLIVHSHSIHRDVVFRSVHFLPIGHGPLKQKIGKNWKELKVQDGRVVGARVVSHRYTFQHDDEFILFIIIFHLKHNHTR